MSKKSKSTTKPYNPAAINAAQSGLTSAVNANAGQLQQNAGLINSLLPGLAERVNDGNPLVTAAQGYAGDVLGGKYLTGNPHLDSIIEQTNRGVSGNVNATFSSAGRTGGGAHQGILARELGDAENRLRYSDYDAERTRMGQAAALTPGLVASELAPMEALLSATSLGSELPYLGARTLVQGTSALQSPYSTTTQKQGLGSSLMNLAGLGMMAFGGGGPFAGAFGGKG